MPDSAAQWSSALPPPPPSARPTALPDYRDVPDDALEAYLECLEAERVAADPWLLPAADRREAAALGDAFHRPYHCLDQADLPHETEDEKLTPTFLHISLCTGLAVGLDARYAGRDDVLAAADLGMYYTSATGPRPGRAAPDLWVAFGVPPEDRSSYVLWKEQVVPAFAMEVLSPSTWRRDVGLKRDIYGKVGIRDYVVFDPDDHIAPRLRGFTLGSDGYRPVPREELPGGMVGVRSAALGLYVCHEEPWPQSGWRAPDVPGKLRWYDPAKGQYIETHREALSRAQQQQARAEAAETRAEAAETRAEAAEARLAELMARLREGRR